MPERRDLQVYLKKSQPEVRCLAFSGWYKKARFRCSCEREWETTPFTMLRRQSGCVSCSQKKRYAASLQEREGKYLVACVTKKLSLLEPYSGALEKHLHRCLVCRTKFSVRPNDVLNAMQKSHNRCPTCKATAMAERKTVPTRQIVKDIEQHGLVKVLRRVNAGRFLVRCRKCDNKFEANRQDLKNGSGCYDCGRKRVFTSGAKRKRYVLGKREVFVQGYEPFALDYLRKRSVPASSILVGADTETPVVPLDQTHRYYPDIFLPDKNLVIEVKSPWTLGLHKTQREVFDKNCEKARATKKQGFHYLMLLFNGRGERLPFPKNWYELSHKQALKFRQKHLCQDIS